jgi:hypothetical protein
VGGTQFVGVPLEVSALEGSGPVPLHEEQTQTVGQPGLRGEDAFEDATAQMDLGAAGVLVFATVDQQCLPYVDEGFAVLLDGDGGDPGVGHQDDLAHGLIISRSLHRGISSS